MKRRTPDRAPLQIGDMTFAAGQRGRVELPVGSLMDHRPLTLPVTVIRGRRDGPCLCVCAAIHGDEINGVEVVRRLLRLRLLSRLRGDLIALPVVNVPAFLARSRYLPDRRDLNRLFPGSSLGSLGARLARVFATRVLRPSTHLIDVHTGAVNRANLSQVRVSEGDEEALNLAKAFGAPVIIVSPTRPGSLRALAMEMGKPVLMFEGGEALRLDHSAVRFGLHGVLSVMRHLGMLPVDREEGVPLPSRSIVATSSYWERTPRGGIFVPAVRLGRAVSEGMVLGTISNPLGGDETPIHCRESGVVIGRANHALADEGDGVFHIARTRNPEKAERHILRRSDEILDEEDPEVDYDPLGD